MIFLLEYLVSILVTKEEVLFDDLYSFLRNPSQFFDLFSMPKPALLLLKDFELASLSHFLLLQFSHFPLNFFSMFVI